MVPSKRWWCLSVQFWKVKSALSLRTDFSWKRFRKIIFILQRCDIKKTIDQTSRVTKLYRASIPCLQIDQDLNGYIPIFLIELDSHFDCHTTIACPGNFVRCENRSESAFLHCFSRRFKKRGGWVSSEIFKVVIIKTNLLNIIPIYEWIPGNTTKLWAEW